MFKIGRIKIASIENSQLSKILLIKHSTVSSSFLYGRGGQPFEQEGQILGKKASEGQK